MVRLLRRFGADQTAATAIEYSLIAAGIALAIVAVVNAIGTQLNVPFEDRFEVLEIRIGLCIMEYFTTSPTYLLAGNCWAKSREHPCYRSISSPISKRQLRISRPTPARCCIK